jgi:hypothetical protein
MQMANRSLSDTKTELLRQELKSLRDRNSMESTFEERSDFVAKLGTKVLPLEDLKSREIFCRLIIIAITSSLRPTPDRLYHISSVFDHIGLFK